MTEFIVKIAPATNAPPMQFKVCQSRHTAKSGTPPFVYLDNWFNTILPPLAPPTSPVPNEIFAVTEWLDYFIIRKAPEITLPAQEFIICRSLATVTPPSKTFGALDTIFKDNAPSPVPLFSSPLLGAVDWSFQGAGIELDGNIAPR